MLLILQSQLVLWVWACLTPLPEPMLSTCSALFISILQPSRAEGSGEKTVLRPGIIALNKIAFSKPSSVQP